MIASVVWFNHQQAQQAKMRTVHYQMASALANTFAAQLDLTNLADSANLLFSFSNKPDWLHNVSLHGPQGRVVFDLSEGDIQSQTGITKVNDTRLIPIVIELKKEQEIAGYLRVAVNLKPIKQAHSAMLVDASSNTRLVFFLIAIAALFISRTFYKSTS
ncbi:hypothetical protein DS2_01490 [Catenovulum agarivorans DS-2]|uniref:Uncharacterized protein n=2 Tax=Catenovulum agarivorans TaxID=1172192 RepID=W7QX95_9ALTE|nr:hypothetical protein DS2_01490 [Catenovulum agarivorans DS-2]